MLVKQLLNAILNRHCLFVLILFIQYNTTFSQMEPVGLFDHHEDVGNPKLKGSAVFNKDNKAYQLSGSGKNIWAKSDQFQFAWKKIKGDFIITATAKIYW